MFLGYVVMNGLTLASIFMIYTGGSIASTFFVTAGTFGTMSAYGYFTKRDLTSMDGAHWYVPTFVGTDTNECYCQLD